MSAIDFYCSVDKVKGVDGKDRVVLTFDGKYLPFTEQVSCIWIQLEMKNCNSDFPDLLLLAYAII